MRFLYSTRRGLWAERCRSNWGCSEPGRRAGGRGSGVSFKQGLPVKGWGWLQISFLIHFHWDTGNNGVAEPFAGNGTRTSGYTPSSRMGFRPRSSGQPRAWDRRTVGAGVRSTVQHPSPGITAVGKQSSQNPSSYVTQRAVPALCLVPQVCSTRLWSCL